MKRWRRLKLRRERRRAALPPVPCGQFPIAATTKPKGA